jgi:hypothetical protein
VRPGIVRKPRVRETSVVDAATKQRIVKTEKTLCAAVTVIFGVCNSVRLSQLFAVTSASVQ